YRAMNRIPEAEALLRQKVESNPKDGRAVIQLAEHFAGTRHLPEMKAAVQRLLDHNQDFPRARIEVGNFYGRIGNWEEAARQFQSCVQSNAPDKLSCQKRLTLALLAQNKRDSALEAIQAIMREHPEDGDTRRMRATLLGESKRPEDLKLAVSEF